MLLSGLGVALDMETDSIRQTGNYKQKQIRDKLNTDKK